MIFRCIASVQGAAHHMIDVGELCGPVSGAEFHGGNLGFRLQVSYDHKPSGMGTLTWWVLPSEIEPVDAEARAYWEILELSRLI